MMVWLYGFWKLCIGISTCCLGQIPDRSKINRSSSLQNHHHMIHGPWPYIDISNNPMAFPKNSECPVYWETPWTVLQGASSVLISLGNHHCKTILQPWWLIILFKTYISTYYRLDICLGDCAALPPSNSGKKKALQGFPSNHESFAVNIAGRGSTQRYLYNPYIWDGSYFSYPAKHPQIHGNQNPSFNFGPLPPPCHCCGRGGCRGACCHCWA